MKKKHCLLIICFSISLLTFAQEPKSNVNYGLKAGTSYSRHTHEFGGNQFGPLQLKYAFGFYVGGFAEIALSKNVKFRLELSFNLLGSKVNADFTKLNIFNRDDPIFIQNFEGGHFRETSISIPLLLQFDINKKIYVLGGPQISYLLSRKENYTSQEAFTLYRLESDKQPIGYGVNARFGYRFDERTATEVGYFHDFNFQNSLKISGFQLGLTYTL